MSEAVLADIKLVLNARGEVALTLDTVSNKELIALLMISDPVFAHTVGAVHRSFTRAFDDVNSDIEKLIDVL